MKVTTSIVPDNVPNTQALDFRSDITTFHILQRHAHRLPASCWRPKW
jgi:hypothetical protein